MRPAASRSDSLTARASWLVFAKTVGFIFAVALPLVLVRRLDREQYGLYKQVFLVVSTAGSLLPIGFGMSAYYYLPRERDKQRQTVLNIMAFNILVGVLACLLIVFYPSILTAIFREPQLAQYAPLVGVFIFTSIVGAFLEIAPIANEEIVLATRFIIGTQLAKAALLIAAALVFGTVRSLLLGAIGYSVIQIAILLLYLESRFPGFWHSFDGRMFRAQCSYAIPLGSAAILFTFQTDLHNYFVSNRFGPVMFAIYAVGTFQLPLMNLLQEATNSVLITRVGLLQKQDQARAIILLTARAARKLAAVYFPVYALLLVVGREFLRFLFTARYSDSWPIFAVNLTLLPAGVLLLDPLFRAYAAERYFLLRLRIATVTVLVVILWLWTGRLGLTGVIAVVVSAGILERSICAVHFGRLIGVNRRDFRLLKDVGKLALASTLAALACAILRHFLLSATPFLVLAICGTAFVIVYLAAVHFLRIASVDEYDQLRELAAHYLPAFLKYRLE